MADRDSFTTVDDGDTMFDGWHNGCYNEATDNTDSIHLIEESDATEYSTSSTTYTSLKSFTLPNNALILGINAKMEIKHDDNTDEVYVRLRMAGTGLTTKYIVATDCFRTQTDDTLHISHVVTETDGDTFKRTNNAYEEVGVSVAGNFVTGSASNLLHVDLHVDATHTGYVQNIKVSIVYVKIFTAD